ncbi:hypothetical protein [Actinoplanes sp. NPDC049681]|uniref:hypothetical protein n=1 Tax=Actinoplanes sp. NPDC049681 TaxID=3363905 RepID=UPI00379E72E3
MMVRKRTAGSLLVAVAMLVAVQACSSTKDSAGGERQVATLVSTGATPAASASAAANRPRERLDTTPEEFEAMLGPYNTCLREHGAKPKEDWRGDHRPTGSEVDKLEAADRICQPLYYPLPPWEKDPSNPEAKDFARDVVTCLKGKGVKYVEVGDNGTDIMLGGEQNDRRSITKGMDLMPSCEQDVAAHRK